MNPVITMLKDLFPHPFHGRVVLVGGSVRDMLLGRENRDVDVVAALSADEFSQCGFRLIHGKTTAPIWFHSHTSRGTVEATPLEDMALLPRDLMLRDFTINAMAMSLSGALIDPLNGQNDLDSGNLRPCSQSCFDHDPLRMFRALRFETEGWHLSDDIENMIRTRDWSERLAMIPIERFTREMLKALAAPRPDLFFQRMLQFEVGQHFLPELFRMGEIPAGPPNHHPEADLWSHALQVLQRAASLSTSPLARFCALFHDIGKLQTPAGAYPRHLGHEEAGFDYAPPFCNRLKLPAAYRTALAWTCKLHGLLNRWGELRDSTRLKVAEQASKARIDDVLPCVSAADKSTTPLTDWELHVSVARLSSQELGLDPVQLEHLKLEERQSLITQRRLERLHQLTLPS